MHIHILGIGGTFMSGLAMLARELGHRVTGHDKACYPPVSDLLMQKGIQWIEDETQEEMMHAADQVIVGNAMKRGMPLIESLLKARKNYVSGPEWLAAHVLSTRRVIAVAGTHGKTTTTSMIAYVLSTLGYDPGFLIGGVVPYFQTNAQLGTGEWFVIEADEYDSAFFDKRPKFLHYRPEIAILNNLEFDHADIYDNLKAIQKQFSYLVRTVPPQGTLLYPLHDTALSAVMDEGVWSHTQTLGIGGDWSARALNEEGSVFEIEQSGQSAAKVDWSLIGQFNIDNGLSALAAAVTTGIPLLEAAQALQGFTPVKRRLEVKGCVNQITVYDDFAHHPTAIQKTLQALQSSHRHQRVIAVLEFASYTMRTGVHDARIPESLALADIVFILKPADFVLPKIGWRIPPHYCETTEELVKNIVEIAQSGDGVLIMSNRGFEGLHGRLLERFLSIS